jgi:hypothetical protein
MSDRKARLRATIEADHAACMAVLNSLTPEEWDMPVPSEEDAPWRARDVLAHLAVSEGGQLSQVRKARAGEAPVPDDFDLRRFNRRSVQKAAGREIADMLAEIEAKHQEMLQELEATPEADFDKSGRHARGDTLTVEGFFHRATEHRRQHAEQLQRALRGG